MKLFEIINWLKKESYNYTFIGSPDIEVSGFTSLENALPGKIVWIKKKENYEKLICKSNVSIAVIQKGINIAVPNQIVSDRSKEVYFGILHYFWGNNKQKGSIGTGTVIAEGAMIAPSAYIGHNCTIIGNVRVGANTIIENNVVIQGKVDIGERCHIQSQSVIGIDGFGYIKDSVTGKKTMIEHFGGIKIGNDVFIASHVNIARGTLDDTIISDGVKIAPFTHIGHNNQIGENATVICANLFGSVKTGKDAYIVASTIQNQSQVGEHSVIGMGSIVTKPIPDNVVAFGIPAKVIKENNSDL